MAPIRQLCNSLLLNTYSVTGTIQDDREIWRWKQIHILPSKWYHTGKADIKQVTTQTIAVMKSTMKERYGVT